jgi:predicted alpha/beta-hydrolase family hydrolase
MLLAEAPELARALICLSYPLHPPKQPEKLRTAHFPQLRTPALFVHGTADPFATVSELRDAAQAITSPHLISTVDGAGHDLNRGEFDISEQIIAPLHGILDL